MAFNMLTRSVTGVARQILNAETADVFFIVGPEDDRERFPVHKFILIVNSNVFETMFYGSLREGNEVMIPDATPHGFRKFLRFCYFGEVIDDIDDAEEAIYLAQKYNVEYYLKACCRFLIKLPSTARNTLIAYQLSIQFDLDSLKHSIEFTIRLQKDFILRSDEICNISRELFKRILQIDCMQLYGKMVLDASMKWAERACVQENIDSSIMANRRKILGDCFELINFDTLTRDDLIKCVSMYGGIFTAEELQRFVIIVGAKCPIPFQVDRISQCAIGRLTKMKKEVRVDSIEELHFEAINRMRLIKIGLSTFFSANQCLVGLIATIAIKKVEGNNAIVLMKEKYRIKSYNEHSNSQSFGKTSIILSEPVILEPNASYCIQMKFVSCLAQPYHYICNNTCSITMDHYPNTIKILPKTNAYAITDFYYNELNPPTNVKMPTIFDLS